jgi:hypothetical protein
MRYLLISLCLLFTAINYSYADNLPPCQNTCLQSTDRQCTARCERRLQQAKPNKQQRTQLQQRHCMKQAMLDCETRCLQARERNCLSKCQENAEKQCKKLSKRK